MERSLGRADLKFLERSFQGLMLNFNWWVNRKDPQGRNVFAAYGRITGHHPWLLGIAMVMLGGRLSVLTMALGG